MSPITDLAYKWMRNYFLDNPGASIDAAAREAKRVSLGLHKSEIARIRRDVRQTIQVHATRPEPARLKSEARALKQTYSPEPIPAEDLVVEPAPRVRVDPTLTEPFNTPKIKLADTDPEADMTLEEALEQSAMDSAEKELVPKDQPDTKPAEVPQVQPGADTKPARTRTVKARAATQATKKVENETMDQKTAKKRIQEFLKADDKKVKWAAEQAMKNPHETTLALNRRVGAKFGGGFQMPTLGEITRLAREAQGIPTKPTKPRKKTARSNGAKAAAVRQVVAAKVGRRASPVEVIVKGFARELRSAGVFGNVQVSNDGSYKFDLKQSVVTGLTGAGSA